VVTQTGAGSSTQQIEIPDDAVIYSPMNELAMSRLRPGQRMRIKTFDPITLQTATVLVEAVRDEDIFVMGESHPTTVLTMTYLGFTMRAWMSKQGRILRQETLIGWTIEATDHADAVSLEFDTEGMDDMVLANPVPLYGTVANQSSCRAITVRMEGFHLGNFLSAVMCSVGARFVYPQLSLEGHGFWIVGMSPVTMGRVLFSKFFPRGWFSPQLVLP